MEEGFAGEERRLVEGSGDAEASGACASSRAMTGIGREECSGGGGCVQEAETKTDELGVESAEAVTAVGLADHQMECLATESNASYFSDGSDMSLSQSMAGDEGITADSFHEDSVDVEVHGAANVPGGTVTDDEVQDHGGAADLVAEVADDMLAEDQTNGEMDGAAGVLAVDPVVVNDPPEAQVVNESGGSGGSANRDELMQTLATEMVELLKDPGLSASSRCALAHRIVRYCFTTVMGRLREELGLRGAVEYVLQHARSSHGAVRSSMFSALGALLLCSPVNASRAVEAGLLSLVFSLLDDSEEDPPARRDAAFCLHLVSGYCYESHKSIVDAGLIPVLVAICSKDADKKEKQSAFSAIYHLSTTKACHASLCTQGVPQLMKIQLESRSRMSEPSVEYLNSMFVCARLSAHAGENTPMLRARDAVDLSEALRTSLNGELWPPQDANFWHPWELAQAVECLAVERQNSRLMVEAGVVSLLVRALSVMPPSVRLSHLTHFHSAAALYELCNEPHGREALAEDACARARLRLLCGPAEAREPEAREHELSISCRLIIAECLLSCRTDWWWERLCWLGWTDDSSLFRLLPVDVLRIIMLYTVLACPENVRRPDDFLVVPPCEGGGRGKRVSILPALDFGASVNRRCGAACSMRAKAVLCDPVWVERRPVNVDALRGKIGVCRRGGGQKFVDKARRLSEAGVCAVCIVNTENKTQAFGGDEGPCTDVPVFMVGRDAEQDILAAPEVIVQWDQDWRFT